MHSRIESIGFSSQGTEKISRIDGVRLYLTFTCSQKEVKKKKKTYCKPSHVSRIPGTFQTILIALHEELQTSPVNEKD